MIYIYSAKSIKGGIDGYLYLGHCRYKGSQERVKNKKSQEYKISINYDIYFQISIKKKNNMTHYLFKIIYLMFIFKLFLTCVEVSKSISVVIYNYYIIVRYLNVKSKCVVTFSYIFKFWVSNVLDLALNMYTSSLNVVMYTWKPYWRFYHDVLIPINIKTQKTNWNFIKWSVYFHLTILC